MYHCKKLCDYLKISMMNHGKSLIHTPHYIPRLKDKIKADVCIGIKYTIYFTDFYSNNLTLYKSVSKHIMTLFLLWIDNL